jgi:hypothetical protein
MARFFYGTRHDEPSLAISPSGRLVTFWSC